MTRWVFSGRVPASSRGLYRFHGNRWSPGVAAGAAPTSDGFSLHEQIHSDCHTSAVWPELSHYLVKTETSSSVSMNQLVIAHRTGPAEPRRDISLVLLSVNRELRLCQVFESKPGWKKRSVLIHLWFCRNVLGSHLFWRSSWAFFDRAASVSEEFGFKNRL